MAPKWLETRSLSSRSSEVEDVDSPAMAIKWSEFWVEKKARVMLSCSRVVDKLIVVENC